MNEMGHQKKVMNFIQDHNLDMSFTYRVLDLISELGEVAKEICKQSTYGQNPFQSDQNFIQELGDVFFSLCALANKCSIDLNHALDETLSKYRKRIQSKGHAGSDILKSTL